MLSLFDISYSATTDDGTLLQCRSSATPNRAKVLSYQSIQNEVGRTKVCFCSILKTVSMGPQWGKAPDLTAWFVTQCSPSPPLSYFIMPFQIYEATFRCFWTNRCPPTHTKLHRHMTCKSRSHQEAASSDNQPHQQAGSGGAQVKGI